MIRAAVVTMDGVHEPVERVLPKVRDWIRHAADSNSEFVLFPELILGHYHDGPIAIDGPKVDEVRKCATELHLGIGIGVGETQRDALYSAYILCGADGSLAVHRKTKWQTKRCPINLGGKAEAHDFAGLRVGVLLCAECRFRDVAADLAADGAQVLIAPFNLGQMIEPPSSGPTIEDVWKNELASRARENACAAVSVASTGIFEQTVAGAAWKEQLQGGVALVDSRGDVIFQKRTDSVRMYPLRIVREPSGIRLEMTA